MNRNLQSPSHLTEFAALSPEPSQPGVGFLLSKFFRFNKGKTHSMKHVRIMFIPANTVEAHLPEHCDWVISILALYIVNPRINSQPRYQLIWLIFIMVLLSSTRLLSWCFKIDCGHFLPHLFNLVICSYPGIKQCITNAVLEMLNQTRRGCQICRSCHALFWVFILYF